MGTNAQIRFNYKRVIPKRRVSVDACPPPATVTQTAGPIVWGKILECSR